jgi:hypothetical protein
MLTQHTQSFEVKPVCQNTYKNQIHNARTSINCMNYSTLCLNKITQFPHKTQDLVATIMCQWKVSHLLLVSTHTLPILLHKVEGRWVGEGERITPKIPNNGYPMSCLLHGAAIIIACWEGLPCTVSRNINLRLQDCFTMWPNLTLILCHWDHQKSIPFNFLGLVMVFYRYTNFKCWTNTSTITMIWKTWQQEETH